MVDARTVEFRPDARRQLERKSAFVAQRILTKIKWLADNYDLVRHEPLSAELKGLFKLRVGDYRVIYSSKRLVITIHLIGHRREIYERK